MAKSKEDKIAEYIENLTDKEKEYLFKTIKSSFRNDIPVHRHYFSKRHIKIGVISDTHIGHKMFIPELLVKAFKYFKKEAVDGIYHIGDIVEGMSGRDGHVYELSHIGGQAQVDYAVELFSMTDLSIYAITGNHDLWLKKKANVGFDVGKTLEQKLKNFTFLGEEEADVKLARNVIMKLFHPNDGSAYARSYKIQKLVESFEGGKKPNILLQGHYHKAGYDFIRNVHAFDAGTIMGQSRWMRGKKLSANIGFWLLDIYFGKQGVDRLSMTFVPYYKEK